MSAGQFQTVRKIVLGVSTLFSLIVLGLAADVLNTTLTLFFDSYFSFDALAVATAVLTLLSLPMMLILDAARTGAFTSWVMFEVIWLSVLWIMWLSTGADAASVYGVTFAFGCNYRLDAIANICREIPAIIAFSFLNWFLLMAYVIALVSFAIMGKNRGHATVWQSSVKQGEFFGPPPTTTGPGQNTGIAQPQPQMYQQYPSTGTPPVPQGYPQNGSQQPYPPSGTPQPYPPSGTPPVGYPQQGYPQPGYPQQSYPGGGPSPVQGYPPQPQQDYSSHPSLYPSPPPQQPPHGYPQV